MLASIADARKAARRTLAVRVREPESAGHDPLAALEGQPAARTPRASVAARLRLSITQHAHRPLQPLRPARAHTSRCHMPPRRRCHIRRRARRRQNLIRLLRRRAFPQRLAERLQLRLLLGRCYGARESQHQRVALCGRLHPVAQLVGLEVVPTTPKPANYLEVARLPPPCRALVMRH